MAVWRRTVPLAVTEGSQVLEHWTLEDDSEQQPFPVRTTYGKPIDILSLKLDVLEDFRAQVEHVKKTRTALFSSPDMETVANCPVCGTPSDKSRFCVEVYNARYHCCPSCSHRFVLNRPGQKALDHFYSEDVPIASTYTDKRTSETRVNQVALPKAEWAVAEFERLYSAKPKRILDVGAGGGHFVHACHLLGFNADGIELSESSRDYCKRHFEFELRAEDFLREDILLPEYDLITFWGVIEHVAEPVLFLQAAGKYLSRQTGMIIAEVPRWECLATAIQSEWNDSLVRHLNPMGHIHIFTDNSLLTAFTNASLAPVAAWYFGMDAYELATQLSYHLEDASVVEKLKTLIPAVQASLDRARFSDEVVLAGVPWQWGANGIA